MSQGTPKRDHRYFCDSCDAKFLSSNSKCPECGCIASIDEPIIRTPNTPIADIRYMEYVPANSLDWQKNMDMGIGVDTDGNFVSHQDIPSPEPSMSDYEYSKKTLTQKIRNHCFDLTQIIMKESGPVPFYHPITLEHILACLPFPTYLKTMGRQSVRLVSDKSDSLVYWENGKTLEQQESHVISWLNEIIV